jgi:hypothetical protein
MPQIDLTDDQAACLREVLEGYLSDLSAEIADTDLKDFRDGLKERKRTLETVLAALPKP